MLSRILSFTLLLLAACPATEAPPPVAEEEPQPITARAPRTVYRFGFPSDFWMFRAGAEHRGRVVARGPRSRPRLLWQARTGGDIWAQPVVGFDGTVYVGSFDHHFYAFNASGRQLWRTDLGDRIYSTALLARGGRIFVGSDADRFYCLSRRGTVRWALRTSEVERRTSAFDADTAAAPGPGGVIYFAAGPHLYAVDADGTVRWRYSAGDKIFSSPAVGPAALGGSIYFGAQDNHLYALSPRGELRFRTDLGDDVDSSPLVAAGLVVVGTDGGAVAALDPADGAVRWRTQLGGHVRASPAAAADGTIYATTYGPTPRLVALDGSTGEQRWSLDLGAGGRPVDYGSHSSPIVDGDGVVYVGAPDGKLRAVDRAGRELWSFETGAWIESSPVLARDGTLFVGTDDGTLFALGR